MLARNIVEQRTVLLENLLPINRNYIIIRRIHLRRRYIHIFGSCRIYSLIAHLSIVLLSSLAGMKRRHGRLFRLFSGRRNCKRSVSRVARGDRLNGSGTHNYAICFCVYYGEQCLHQYS